MVKKLSDIVIYDQPEYSRVEKDTHDPIVAAGVEQSIHEAGTVFGRITATGKYVQLDPAASDGSQVAAMVSLQTTIVPANTDTVTLGEFRHARLHSDALVWPDGITDEQKQDALDELEAAGIIAE